MGRKVAIAIGVAGSVPRSYLTGALNGARDFAGWATSMGYETTLIVDDPTPVTMLSLKAGMVAALKPAEGPIERLIIYFAGHGLIRGAEENLWLLSDWQTELRAVEVDILKRRLMRFGVEQVVLIGDACSSLPGDMTAADLVPDVPLPKGPTAPTGQEETDRFLAAQDGQKAYMIPGNVPEQDRCVFTGVLMEGLWGAAPRAFSIGRPDAVTSQSLAGFLRTEVPARAAVYGYDLKPTVQSSFSEGRDLYFTRTGGPPAPPLGAWPAPPAPPPPSPSNYRNKSAFGFPGGPPEMDRGAGSDFLVDREAPWPASDHFTPEPDPLRSWLSQPGPENARGLVIDGGQVEAIWSDTPVEVAAEPDAAQARIGFEGGGAASSLVQFADGRAGAFVILDGMTVRALKTARGVAAVTYAPAYWSDMAVSRELAEALLKMERAALRADDVTDLAVSLRQAKHLDPVLGVISAYLYRAIDDTDSIRRMAFFYADLGQAIPYDIALLGRLERAGDGQAQVPAVPESAPRGRAEERADWAWGATPARTGRIGGRWPWMRQGWAHLEDAEDQPGSIVEPGLADLAIHLATARFTTLEAAGVEPLAELMGLQPRPLRPAAGLGAEV